MLLSRWRLFLSDCGAAEVVIQAGMGQNPTLKTSQTNPPRTFRVVNRRGDVAQEQAATRSPPHTAGAKHPVSGCLRRLRFIFRRFTRRHILLLSLEGG